MKKVPLNPQKLSFFCNRVAKRTKVLRGVGRSFTKDLPKLDISKSKILFEFADHKTIASRLNAPVYFAHPHSPWERGLMTSSFVPDTRMANGHCLSQGRALAVFSKENEDCLHCSVPRGLPTKN